MPRSLPQTPLNQRLGSSFRCLTSSFRNASSVPRSVPSSPSIPTASRIPHPSSPQLTESLPLKVASPDVPSLDTELPSANSNVKSATALTQLSLTDALLYQDGILLSGSLSALIQHLVPTNEYFPEKTYIFAFLLSSRLFLPPHELLERMGQVCAKQQKLRLPVDVVNGGAHRHKGGGCLAEFGIHIIKLLNQWISTFPQDFRDERMMRNLMALTKAIEHKDAREYD
jgi:hypothetical protein